MFAYSVRRILTAIPVLLIALYAVHVGVSYTTDPVADLRQCLPRCQAGFDAEFERHNLGTHELLRPFPWAADAVTGDLGESDLQRKPVTDVLVTRGWKTAQVAIPAFALAAILALMLSVFSARRQYSLGDYVFTGAAFVGIAFPAFVLGLVLTALFIIQLPRLTAEWTWLPEFAQGWKPFYLLGERPGLTGYLSRATLPIITLAVLFVAADSRFGRSAMLEVLSSDYVRTARAKGLSERRVVWKHALRNALIPMVTLWALNFSALLGGSVVTETIFNWPGLGEVFPRALQQPDLNLLMGIVILTTFLTVAFNLIADLLYGVLDPRIRYD